MVSPDDLSPRAALELVYELRRLLDGGALDGGALHDGALDEGAAG